MSLWFRIPTVTLHEELLTKRKSHLNMQLFYSVLSKWFTPARSVVEGNSTVGVEIKITGNLKPVERKTRRSVEI